MKGEKDVINVAPATNPDKPFYSVYTLEDGTKAYYRHDMEFYYRYVGTYGHFEGRWSYTANEADKVYN